MLMLICTVTFESRHLTCQKWKTNWHLRVRLRQRGGREASLATEPELTRQSRLRGMEVIKRTLYGAITDIMTWDTELPLPPPHPSQSRDKNRIKCYKKYSSTKSRQTIEAAPETGWREKLEIQIILSDTTNWELYVSNRLYTEKMFSCIPIK